MKCFAFLTILSISIMVFCTDVFPAEIYNTRDIYEPIGDLRRPSSGIFEGYNIELADISLIHDIDVKPVRKPFSVLNKIVGILSRSFFTLPVEVEEKSEKVAIAPKTEEIVEDKKEEALEIEEPSDEEWIISSYKYSTEMMKIKDGDVVEIREIEEDLEDSKTLQVTVTKMNQEGYYDSVELCLDRDKDSKKIEKLMDTTKDFVVN